MASGPLFLRLGVPSGMEDLLEGLAREVLRHQPRDIYRFAATHFEGLLLQREAAHNAGLSPSLTNAQDGLNQNTDSNKQQQQGPVVTDDIATKVDVPLDRVPQSPASDSGAASAASSPASSPVRPPREKNKPQAVRAKLTTTGDRHPSPILQQALQAAALTSENRSAESPEETTPKSGATSPTEESNKTNTVDINSDKKDDNNSRSESQNASESKTSSPIKNNEAVFAKEENLSTANSPDNLNKSPDKSESSRFITTPVKEIENIFPVVNDSVSGDERTGTTPEKAPSSPANLDDEKTESEIKVSEAEEQKSAQDENTDKLENENIDTVSSPVAADEIVVTPAVSPSNVAAAPEENQPDAASAPQSPTLPENEASASRTSKRISELGSEDFKPQTPEVLIHSPDQSTCDDVSAAVLAEDEPSAPAEQMQVVQEEIVEESAEEVAIENSVAPEGDIVSKSDEAEENPASPPVEEKSESVEQPDVALVTSGNEPEDNYFPETLDNVGVNVDTAETNNAATTSPEIKPEEPCETKSEDKISEEKLDAPVEETVPSEKEEVVEEVKIYLISNEQKVESPEENENTEDKTKSKDVVVVAPEDLPPGTPSEKLTLDGIESLDPLEPEPQPVENVVDDNKESEAECVNNLQQEETAIEENNDGVQLSNEQNVEEPSNTEENVEEPVEPDELTNPETGTPVQSQPEEIVQDAETGILSEADENSAPVVPEDKMAEFVAMSPDVAEAGKESIAEENGDQNIASEPFVNPEVTLPVESNESEVIVAPPSNGAADVADENDTEKSNEATAENLPEISNTDVLNEEKNEIAASSAENEIIKTAAEDVAVPEVTEEVVIPEENKESEITQISEMPAETEGTENLGNIIEEKTPEETEEKAAASADPETAGETAAADAETEGETAAAVAETAGETAAADAETEGGTKSPVSGKSPESPIEPEVENISSSVQENAPESLPEVQPETEKNEISETDNNINIEEETTSSADQGPEIKTIDESKLTSPTPPPSPVQSPGQEESVHEDVVQSAAEEIETIDEASGEVEKISVISEEIDKSENKKNEEAENSSYPVPSTAIDFTPATPSQSPVNEEENKEDKNEDVISNVEDEVKAVENIEEDTNVTQSEAENTEEKIETTENTEENPVKHIVVVEETAQQQENVIHEVPAQESITDGTQDENIVETSKETGEILPVQSSTEQDTVIQVTQEEPTPSDSQSSILGNEGLGAVSSVVIRYSLSDVNENPDESNEEGVKQLDKVPVGGEEETDKTEEEILKEEQEIADTLIAAVRESEETPTETVSCENNSISGGEEIQPSISEPAEVASIQTGSSKDAESLQHDDIQKETIIIEPIDLSALDESDKLEESMIISEVSNTDSAAEEKIEETQPTIDSTQFQMDDISIGTAVQDMVETPSSGEQLAKDVLLGENMTQNEEEELEAAATKIQASFRGHQSRKALNATETLAQETLVPAMAAVREEAAETTWHAVPAQVMNEVDEEKLLAQTESSLAEAQKRYLEENSNLSALEELVQNSTLIAATPLAYSDSSPPLSTTAPHLNQLRTTYSSSGEAADVSASVTEPVSWNGGVSRVLDEESGELITPDDDEGVWATLEREIGETQEQELAATKIQAGFRGHKARQSLLQREDAVQIVTSSASDVSNTPFSGVRHTGEFHDSLLLPLSGEVPSEQQSSRLVHDTAVEDAAANTQPIAANIQEDTDVITEPQVIVLDENVTSDFDNMSENSESFLDKAATRIQATFRGFKTRNEIKQKSPVRTPSPSDIEAATKIQAGFRGYQVRKDMKNSSPPKLGRIQSAPEIRIEESEEERSATKIQAGVRGYLTRQRLKKERSPQPPPSPSPEPTSPEIEGAVVKLQAGFRGYKARQDVKQLREGKDVKN